MITPLTEGTAEVRWRGGKLGDLKVSTLSEAVYGDLLLYVEERELKKDDALFSGDMYSLKRNVCRALKRQGENSIYHSKYRTPIRRP
jgi:hypothetical protein